MMSKVVMMNTIYKRILFEEKNWTITTSGAGSRVEHLNCRVKPRVEFDGRYPTYGTVNYCYGCKEPMPEFILNMRTFLRWCGEW